MKQRGVQALRTAGHVTVVLAIYAALAMFVLSPGISDLWRSSILPEFPAGAHEADINLINWILAWDWHALTTAPLSLYQANIFHPAPDALAASEHLLGHLPVFGPAWALTGNPVFAGQFTVLMSFALSGAAVYALLRHWGTGAVAALFAGMVFTFASVRLRYLAHFHLLAGHYLPLALIAFDRCLQQPQWRWALAFAVLLFLQLLCSYYLAYITAVAMIGYGAGVLWARRARIPARAAIQLGITSAVMLVAFVAISIPYLRLAGSGAIPEYDDLAVAIASTDTWRSYLVRSFPSAADGPYALPKLYLGWSVLLPALAAFGWRRTSTAAVPWAAAGALGLAVACYVVGLGPTTATKGEAYSLPYAWLRDVVPGFSSMRVPQRFAVFVALGVACLSGLGVDRLLGGRRRAGLIVAPLFLLAAWDLGLLHRKFDSFEQEVGADLPPIYRHVSELPPGPLLELPMRDARSYFFTGSILESRRMLASTYHWLPLLNGQSGYPPASYWTVVTVAQALPDPRALVLLARMTGLRYVLVHSREFTRIDGERWKSPIGLRQLHRAGGDLLFEVVNPLPMDLRDRLLESGQPTHTVLGTPIERLPESGRLAEVELTETFGEQTFVNQIRVIRGVLTNGSDHRWPAVSPSPVGLVTLRCRWSTVLDTPVVTRGPFELRLPFDLSPGKKVDFEFQCSAPAEPGTYLLQVSAAQSDDWFDGGSEHALVDVVRPPRRRR